MKIAKQLTDLMPISASFDKEGRIEIAGARVSQLAAEYGTPLYLFDAQTIKTNALDIITAFQHYQGMFEISYASKTYLSLNMARKISVLGLGADVVSLGELHMAIKGGFPPGKIHLHGNNKSESEIAAAIEHDIHCIVIDSLEELDFTANIAKKTGKKVRIWLRITPGIDVDTHPYWETANRTSKFGLPVDDGQAAEAIKRASMHENLDLIGLHTHLGSQIHEAAPYIDALELIVNLCDQVGYIPRELSPGGGWGVPYSYGDSSENVSVWVEGVTHYIHDAFTQRGWTLPKIILEPGRWLVARSGVVVYTIGTTKFSADGTYFVSIDGGMADNPRVALYQAKYTACLADRPYAPAVHRGAIVGKFCESGDELIYDIHLPEVRRGEYLLMPVAGAYQLSMSSNYNLAPRPTVLWLEDGKCEVLQKKETPHHSGWWVDG